MTTTQRESAGCSGEVDESLVLGYGEGERCSLTREMVQCTMPFLCGIMVVNLWRSTDGTDA
jgi:hypothetical protein